MLHEHLSALRAAEAVARLGSLRAAADELRVTPGAVSQQIARLEARLGRKLFRRLPRGMEPTQLGLSVAEHLTRGFQELERALALARARDESVVTISVAPIFAGRWLVWRLDRFAQANPGARVRVEATVDLVAPGTGEVDACIRVGRGDWPGVRLTKLVEQRVFPVCAPERAQTIRAPRDLFDHPVIRDTNSMIDWDVWLRPNGLSKDGLRDGPLYSDSALCLDAAIAGQGVFLGWETLAVDAIAAGRLVAPLPGRFRTGLAYWFVEAEGARRRPVVAAFHDWLAGELEAFAR